MIRSALFVLQSIFNDVFVVQKFPPSLSLPHEFDVAMARECDRHYLMKSVTHWLRG